MAKPEKTPEQIAEEQIEQALDSQTTALDLSGLGLTILPETSVSLRSSMFFALLRIT
jgi:hypothetical protein